MPLLYGEGSKAFIRVREEIMKITSDHTIFAWDSSGLSHGWHNLLAPGVACFKTCGDLIQWPRNLSQTPHSMTNVD